jgi:hypothetical protein
VATGNGSNGAKGPHGRIRVARIAEREVKNLYPLSQNGHPVTVQGLRNVMWTMGTGDHVPEGATVRFLVGDEEVRPDTIVVSFAERLG